MKVTRSDKGLELELQSEIDTETLGRALADCAAPGLVIGLIGPLGAGKTRLARAISEALGVEAAAIGSPTFVLIHEYEGRIPIYHLDAYRLPSPRAFEDLGVADYWNAGGICLVEWADRVLDLLPEGSWLIRIEPVALNQRMVQIELPEPPYALLDALARRLASTGHHQFS